MFKVVSLCGTRRTCQTLDAERDAARILISALHQDTPMRIDVYRAGEWYAGIEVTERGDHLVL